ncbi:DMT family transporter [Bifidobacterium tsurumiense]|uniref:DMT family transporter n=1 Tax=Bifidobacterium tsurumiense TaxID=356829 RepID=UPI0018A6CBE2|nr:DMT family transporter [Bifidobacterium tsurumiense]
MDVANVTSTGTSLGSAISIEPQHKAANDNNVGTTNPSRIPTWTGRLMLLITAAGWGCGYSYAHRVLEVVPLQWMMAIRLIFGTVVIGIIAWKRILRTPLSIIFIPGLILAVTYWAAFMVQMTGLHMTAPGRNAFLTATYCVLVPFLMWAFAHRRPTRINLIAAGLCLIGVAFVSMSGSTSGSLFTFGDLVSFGGGALFGVNIALTGILAKKFDALTLTFYEFAISDVMFIIGGLLFSPTPQASWFTSDIVFAIAYLVVVSTLIAQVFQNLAFAVVPASQGSLILCLESVFGVVFSMFATGEKLTTAVVIGFALIFISILLSEIRLPKRKHPIEG